MKSGSIVATVAAIAAMSCGVWFCAENMRLRTQVNSMEVALSALRGKVAVKAETAIAPVGEKEVVVVASEASSTPVSKQARESGAASAWSFTRDLSGDLSWRAGSIAHGITDLEGRFGRFFLGLKNLTPEQLASLKRLMATQQLELGRLAFPERQPESAEALARRMQLQSDLERTQETELRAAMGDENYREYQTTQRVESYRGAVAAVVNGMRAQGVNVDDAHEQKILENYASAMAAVGRIAQQEDGARDLSRLNERERAELRDRQIHRMQLQLAQSMASVLDEAALNAFITAQIAQE